MASHCLTKAGNGGGGEIETSALLYPGIGPAAGAHKEPGLSQNHSICPPRPRPSSGPPPLPRPWSLGLGVLVYQEDQRPQTPAEPCPSLPLLFSRTVAPARSSLVSAPARLCSFQRILPSRPQRAGRTLRVSLGEGLKPNPQARSLDLGTQSLSQAQPSPTHQLNSS